MAKNNKTAAEKPQAEKTETKTVYVVANGNAFTHNGVIYGAGDKIAADAFGDEKTFSAMVKAKRIIEKEEDVAVSADEAGADADKAADTDGGNDAADGGDGTEYLAAAALAAQTGTEDGGDN